MAMFAVIASLLIGLFLLVPALLWARIAAEEKARRRAYARLRGAWEQERPLVVERERAPQKCNARRDESQQPQSTPSER